MLYRLSYGGISEVARSSLTKPLLVLALPIFPGRLQPSIVGRIELNFRVRDGNGWTLDLINTNYSQGCTLKTEQRYWMSKAFELPALL